MYRKHNSGWMNHTDTKVRWKYNIYVEYQRSITWKVGYLLPFPYPAATQFYWTILRVVWWLCDAALYSP